MKSRILWVEATKTAVSLRTGAKMPSPEERGLSWMFLGGVPSVTVAEFTRWSGIKFPRPGIYGLQVKMAVVKRLRKVVEVDYVAAERTRTKYVEERAK